MAVPDNRFSQEFSENWRILTVAFTCLLFAFSAPAFLMPFLYPEVIREFGWTREQAVVLASYKYITGSIVSIVVGRFIDIISVRRVLIFVTILGGLAMLSFLWTPNLSIYYVAGIMLGFSGAGTMVSIKVLVSRTFHASQGTAMGVAMLGTGVGSILVPFAATFLMEAWGWRIGAALLSAGVWLIALPLMIFYLTDESFIDASDDAETPPAAIDWPVASYYKELVELNPNAKVLLTVRDEDSWYRSLLATLYTYYKLIPRWRQWLSPKLRNRINLQEVLVWNGVFNGRVEDAEYAKKIFRDHNEEVKRTVPADRLLVVDLAKGWGPICEFLGKPIPKDTPFPHINTADKTQHKFRKLRLQKYIPYALLTVVVILVLFFI